VVHLNWYLSIRLVRQHKTTINVSQDRQHLNWELAPRKNRFVGIRVIRISMKFVCLFVCYLTRLSVSRQYSVG
jgi:hypothetical protein